MSTNTSSSALSGPLQYTRSPSSGENITEEPKPVLMDANRLVLDEETYKDDCSGYQRERNECTEFFLDYAVCFGAFDACCPLSGEGCFSSCASFWGNICVALKKC